MPKGTLFTGGVSARIMEQLLNDFNVNTIVKLADGIFEPYTSISSYLIFFEHTGKPTKDIWYYEILPSGGRKKYSKTKPIYSEDFDEISKWWNKRKVNDNCWKVSINEIISTDEKGVVSVNLDYKNPNTIYGKEYKTPLQITSELNSYTKSILTELNSINSEFDKYFSSLTSDFELVPLSKVLKQYRVEIWIEENKQYNQLTISKYDGIKQRGKKNGYDIGRKRQFVVDLDKYPNTILYTRQTLQQDDAIGLAPYDVNGCIATENMPMFYVDGVEPLYVHYFLKSNYFLNQLHKTSAKGTSQQTIHEDTFLTYLIPLPPREIQLEIIELLEKIIDLKNKQNEINLLISDLFPSALQGMLTNNKNYPNYCQVY